MATFNITNVTGYSQRTISFFSGDIPFLIAHVDMVKTAETPSDSNVYTFTKNIFSDIHDSDIIGMTSYASFSGYSLPSKLLRDPLVSLDFRFKITPRRGQAFIATDFSTIIDGREYYFWRYNRIPSVGGITVYMGVIFQDNETEKFLAFENAENFPFSNYIAGVTGYSTDPPIFGEEPYGVPLFSTNATTFLAGGVSSQNVLTGDLFDIFDSDPYGKSGTSTTGGGDKTPDFTGDPIPVPTIPTASASDSGFVRLYLPTKQELNALASYLWASNGLDISQLKRLVADPMDLIIGISIIPELFDISALPITTPRVGNIDITTLGFHYTKQQYVEKSCGSLTIPEQWGSYLDYSPYTKVEIYLPYIGIRPLSADDVIGKPLEVVYHIDILSGACIAMIKCYDSVLYSYIGQCSANIPLNSADWTGTINGILSIATATGAMIATGGAAAPMAVGGAIAATAANDLKPEIQKSGAISGTGGILGIQTPYLILTVPRLAIPAGQNRQIGYPSWMTSTVGELSGFTAFDSIHLENVPATGDELAEIEQILKSGVLL